MKASISSHRNFFYRTLLLIICGCFILGQFGRIELPNARAVYFQDFFIALFVGVYVLSAPSVLWSFLHTKIGKVITAFTVWIAVTSVIHFAGNTTQLLSAFFYLIRFDSMFAFGCILVALIQQKVVTRSELASLIVCIVAAIATLGFGQYLFSPDTRGLQLLGWDDHYYRLISTLFDPGYTGIILAIGSLISLSLLLHSKHTIRNTFLIKLSFVFTFAALLLTYSRASYLAFIIGVLFLAWKTKRYKIIVLAPVFIMCIFFLPRPGGEGVKLERTASVTARIESVNSSLTDFTPLDTLIGKGWYWKKESQPTSLVGTRVVPNHSTAAENSYVFLFTSLGIIGTLIWSVGLYFLLQWSQWDTNVTLTMILVGVHAMFTNTFFYAFVLILMALIMARSAPRYLAKFQ